MITAIITKMMTMPMTMPAIAPPPSPDGGVVVGGDENVVGFLSSFMVSFLFDGTFSLSVLFASVVSCRGLNVVVVVVVVVVVLVVVGGVRASLTRSLNLVSKT